MDRTMSARARSLGAANMRHSPSPHWVELALCQKLYIEHSPSFISTMWHCSFQVGKFDPFKRTLESDLVASVILDFHNLSIA